MKKIIALVLGLSLVFSCIYITNAESKSRVEISKNPSDWTIVNGLKLRSTKLYNDKIDNFWNIDGFDFKDCSIIQTTCKDSVNEKCSSPDNGEAWAELKLRQSADIYILSFYKEIGSYMNWLSSEHNAQLVKDENGAELKIQSSEGKWYFVYKIPKTVKYGSEETVYLGNIGPNNRELMYSIIINWIPDYTESISLLLNSKKAIVNGVNKELDIPAQTLNDRTMVPVRFLSESLGAKVDWDEEKQKVTIIKDLQVIEINIGAKSMLINGEMKDIDAPATVLEGRTLLPLRAISEAFNKKVFWDDRGLIIIGDMIPEKGDEFVETILSQLK